MKDLFLLLTGFFVLLEIISIYMAVWSYDNKFTPYTILGIVTAIFGNISYIFIYNKFVSTMLNSEGIVKNGLLTGLNYQIVGIIFVVSIIWVSYVLARILLCEVAALKKYLLVFSGVFCALMTLISFGTIYYNI